MVESVSVVLIQDSLNWNIGTEDWSAVLTRHDWSWSGSRMRWCSRDTITTGSTGTQSINRAALRVAVFDIPGILASSGVAPVDITTETLPDRVGGRFPLLLVLLRMTHCDRGSTTLNTPSMQSLTAGKLR